MWDHGDETTLKPRRCPMPQPMLCLDEGVRHGAERLCPQCSKLHSQDVVTVLLGLMECDGRRTLSGRLSQVGEALSRREATPGGSRTGTPERAAAQTSRLPQTALGDRVGAWARATRRPVANGSWARAWYKDALSCWIADVPWLRSSPDKRRSAKPKRERFRGRSNG
jgi:hypothetical protein